MWLCQLFLPFYLKNHPNTCSGDAEHTCALLKSFAGLWRTSNKYKLCPTKIDKSPPSGLTKVLWTEHNVMGPGQICIWASRSPEKTPPPPTQNSQLFLSDNQTKKYQTFFFDWFSVSLCFGWLVGQHYWFLAPTIGTNPRLPFLLSSFCDEDEVISR